MGRKKAANPEKLYSRRLQVKVTQAVYERLEALQQNTDCKSTSEFVRRVISREQITTFIRDTSLDHVMEELVRIRKELNAIGHNINQITHHFHSTAFPKEKLFYALKAVDEFQKVQTQVRTLLSRITELGKKWLQR